MEPLKFDNASVFFCKIPFAHNMCILISKGMFFMPLYIWMDAQFLYKQRQLKTQTVPILA